LRSSLVDYAGNRMALLLRYHSGEEIRKGDHVRFHGNPAQIVLVADDASGAGADWHIREFGGGVMVLDPAVSGRTFIPADQLEEYEDLEFFSRA